jgi:predicted enzyme related to lactoylglutathione lyase
MRLPPRIYQRLANRRLQPTAAGAILSVMDTKHPRGLAQLNLWADDVAAAAKWYTDVLGTKPYFARPEQGPPAYVEFRFGDYRHELDIIDRKFAPPAAAQSPGGAVARLHVDDINASVERLKSLGAKEYEPITPRGQGFVTASVVDPFGNVLGLIHSPHYLETLR